MEDKVVAYRVEGTEVELLFPVRDGQGWVYQGQMAEIFGLGQQRVMKHVQRALAETGSERAKHVKKMKILRTEPCLKGTREATRVFTFYSLRITESVGFFSRSRYAARFSRWVEDVADEVERLSAKPLVETVDLRTPPAELSPLDVVLKKWLRESRETSGQDSFRPAPYLSVYDAVANRCFDLLAQTENKKR
jgi:prophage antirepressor-like protein